MYAGRTSVLKFAVAAALLLACSGHAALAQSDSKPRFDIFVSAQESYENNVLRQPKGFPVQPGFTRDDFRLSPSLNVDILRPIGRQTLTLAGGVGYDFYRRNKLLERERINLQGKVDLAIGPNCTPQLGVAYSRQQSDLSDFIALTTQRLRNREQILTINGGVKCGGIVGLRPGVTVERSTARNSSFFRRTGNYNSTSVGLSLGYTSPTIGEVSLFGNYRRGFYPDRGRFILGQGSIGDNVTVYATGLRLEREIGSRITGDISVGYTRADPSIPGTRKFSGLSGSADLTVKVLEPLQVVIGYSRAVEQSNQLDVSFTVNDTYNATASYVVGPQLLFTGGAARTSRRLSNSLLLTPNPLGLSDKTTQIFGGVRYSPRGPISFSLNASRSSRNSDTRIFDYKASAVTLGVNLNL